MAERKEPRCAWSSRGTEHERAWHAGVVRGGGEPVARRAPSDQPVRPRLPVAGRGCRLVLHRAHYPAGDRLRAQPRIRADLRRPAAAARRGDRRGRHRDADHGGKGRRTRQDHAGERGDKFAGDRRGSGPARAGRRLRHGRRPARDRLGHAVQRRVPPVRRAAGYVPARARPPAGRPGRARCAAAHGHHRLAVGQRALGGHPGVAAQLLALVAALLLGAAPWRVAEVNWTRRASSSAAATIIAALTAALATVVVIGNGLAGAPASGAALVVAGGAGVLVLAVRVFMLVNQNGIILDIWQESSRSLRELASRTSDVLLVCDLEGVISYASPAVGDYGYAPGDLTGRRLLDFVHPEDRSAVLTASRLAVGGRAARDQAGAAAETADTAGRFPARVRAADGTWRHVESTVLRYQVPGAPRQILVTARDV